MLPKENGRLLRRREVTEVYGIPIRFLETAAQNGAGPKFIKVGRLCFYRQTDIELWLDLHTIGNRPEGGAQARINNHPVKENDRPSKNCEGAT